MQYAPSYQKGKHFILKINMNIKEEIKEQLNKRTLLDGYYASIVWS
jgi:hypothetical protein